MSTAEKINARLRVLVNECDTEALREAMAYSLFAGGKQLRPLLLLASCESVCGSYSDTALDFACALEMIHTYSLIHDDLPAMDDDDLRRGIPTSHIKFGEATAILAGDALLNLAYETMALRLAYNLSGGMESAYAMTTMARAAGVNGMIAGQIADMAWEGKPADPEMILYIHARKTGALITAGIEAGAILGGASAEALARYTELGGKFGLAFQIRDDILDVIATDEELGKPAHSDEKNGKNTYVTVFGMERALADYNKISAEAINILSEIPHKTSSLTMYVSACLKRRPLC